MKRCNISLLVIFALTSIEQVHSEGNLGLCTAKETNYFSCTTTKHRWINLCAGLHDNLQYRFGKAGNVELQFPNAVTGDNSLFKYAHYFRAQTDRFEVSFQNQTVSYTIFDYQEDKQRHAGVRVTDAKGQETELSCVGRISNRLSELKTKLQCDHDNALNLDSCE